MVNKQQREIQALLESRLKNLSTLFDEEDSDNVTLGFSSELSEGDNAGLLLDLISKSNDELSENSEDEDLTKAPEEIRQELEESTRGIENIINELLVKVGDGTESIARNLQLTKEFLTNSKGVIGKVTILTILCPALVPVYPLLVAASFAGAGIVTAINKNQIKSKEAILFTTANNQLKAILSALYKYKDNLPDRAEDELSEHQSFVRSFAGAGFEKFTNNFNSLNKMKEKTGDVLKKTEHISKYNWSKAAYKSLQKVIKSGGSESKDAAPELLGGSIAEVIASIAPELVIDSLAVIGDIKGVKSSAALPVAILNALVSFTYLLHTKETSDILNISSQVLKNYSKQNLIKKLSKLSNNDDSKISQVEFTDAEKNEVKTAMLELATVMWHQHKNMDYVGSNSVTPMLFMLQLELEAPLIISSAKLNYDLGLIGSIQRSLAKSSEITKAVKFITRGYIDLKEQSNSVKRKLIKESKEFIINIELLFKYHEKISDRSGFKNAGELFEEILNDTEDQTLKEYNQELTTKFFKELKESIDIPAEHQNEYLDLMKEFYFLGNGEKIFNNLSKVCNQETITNLFLKFLGSLSKNDVVIIAQLLVNSEALLEQREVFIRDTRANFISFLNTHLAEVKNHFFEQMKQENQEDNKNDISNFDLVIPQYKSDEGKKLVNYNLREDALDLAVRAWHGHTRTVYNLTDEPISQENERALKTSLGFSVDKISQLTDALSKFNAFPSDLYILDIELELTPAASIQAFKSFFNFHDSRVYKKLTNDNGIFKQSLDNWFVGFIAKHYQSDAKKLESIRENTYEIRSAQDLFFGELFNYLQSVAEKSGKIPSHYLEILNNKKTKSFYNIPEADTPESLAILTAIGINIEEHEKITFDEIIIAALANSNASIIREKIDSPHIKKILTGKDFDEFKKDISLYFKNTNLDFNKYSNIGDLLVALSQIRNEDVQKAKIKLINAISGDYFKPKEPDKAVRGALNLDSKDSIKAYYNQHREVFEEIHGIEFLARINKLYQNLDGKKESPFKTTILAALIAIGASKNNRTSVKHCMKKALNDGPKRIY